jgi:hypothetical protein
MKLSVLKTLVGFFLVVLHLVAGGICFVWLKQRLEPDDFRLTILILAPVATLYAVAYVKDVIKAMNNPTAERSVPKDFAALTIIYSIAFGVGVLYQIYDFYSAHMTPNELKEQLALFELFGGGILGLLLDELFGKQMPPSQVDPAKSSAPSAGAAT